MDQNKDIAENFDYWHQVENVTHYKLRRKQCFSKITFLYFLEMCSLYPILLLFIAIITNDDDI